MQLKINSFKNYYCDSITCALSEFIDIDDEGELLKKLTLNEAKTIAEFAVVKNILAGVGHLQIKVPYPGLGLEALEKYGLMGKEILSARLTQSLTTSQLVGGRIILDVENLVDYNESSLLEISDFCGRLRIPIIINLGQNLEDVGKLVNRYGKSPGRVLEDFGFLDRECLVYGMNFIDKDDQTLLKDYNALLIFSPRSDGEEGKGFINLYNFVYNQAKFAFASGKCYDIDMLAEAKLAILNTNNLMYEKNLISYGDIISALCNDDGDVLIEKEEAKKTNIFNEKINVENEFLTENYKVLKDKIKLIVKKLKE